MLKDFGKLSVEEATNKALIEPSE